MEGQKRYHKKTSLTQLDIAHEQLRMQLFLAYEMGYFKFTDGRTEGNAAEMKRSAGRRSASWWMSWAA